QEQGLHHAPADAESRLGRGPEAADHPVDDSQDHEQHEKFTAGGQADVENAADERQPWAPLIRAQPDVVLEPTTIDPPARNAERTRDAAGESGGRRAEWMVRAAAGDQP